VTQTVLESYADRGNRMAQLFLEWSISEKLRGTFIEGLDNFLYRDGDGLPTLHTGFKLHGTVTGRLSSAEPNLQQLPRESKGRTSIRSLFVAGSGHLLIVADYDQIELRCLAYAAEEPAMIQIFREGRDIHREATATAMRIDPTDVTSDLRQLGKTLNFATGYGAGAERIAATAKVTKKRGQQFLDRYYEEFSALEPWKASLLREARSRCDMSDPLRFPPYVDIPISHRRRRLPDLMPLLVDTKWAMLRAERQAVNAYVQGFAANITKMAMRQLHLELTEFPAQILAQVHDEIVVRVDETAVDGVMACVQRVMSGITDEHGRPILGEIPLVVSAACGPSWAEAKQ
jgi:DNA polymerase-1